MKCRECNAVMRNYSVERHWFKGKLNTWYLYMCLECGFRSFKRRKDTKDE